MLRKMTTFAWCVAAVCVAGLLAGAANWSGTLESRLATVLGSRNDALELLNLAAGGGGVNVEQYGATGNDLSDDTAAFNKAVDAVWKSGGGTINIPQGTYYIQGVDLREGVYFRGSGFRKGGIATAGQVGATTLKIPANPLNNVSMFRVPVNNTPVGYDEIEATLDSSTDVFTATAAHNLSLGQAMRLYPKNGPMPTCATLSDVLVAYAGPATNGAAMGGTTFRLYTTLALAQAGGSSGVHNFTTNGFTFTAVSSYCTANANGFVPGDAVRCTSTGTLPAGLSAGTTVFVGRPIGVGFALYDTSVNAIAGGATGLIAVDAGTGTHSIALHPQGQVLGLQTKSNLVDFAGGGIFDCELDGSANGGALAVPSALNANQIVGIDFSGVSTLYNWNIERCYFHNFDVAYKDAFLGDIGLYVSSCEARYNFCAFQCNEQPLFVNCTINANYYGLAGRLIDCVVIGGYLGINRVGCSGYLEYTGRWAGTAAPASNQGVSNTIFQGVTIWGNTIVGVVLASNSALDGCLIVGSNVDSTNDGSTGVRIQGDGNRIVGCTFGEGTNGSSFNRTAILLDTALSSTLIGTNISGNTFHLQTCPAITGGNSVLSLYGAAAYGNVFSVNVVGNTFRAQGHRAIRLSTTNGTARYWNVCDNFIESTSGGAAGANAVMTTTDGFVEGAFWRCSFRDNYFNNASGTNTLVCFKPLWGTNIGGVTTGNQFTGNSFIAASGTAPGIAFNAAVDVDTLVTNNVFNEGSTGITYASTNAAIIKNNVNYVTEATGSGTTSAATTAVVTHGLALTPTVVNVDPTSTTATAGAPFITGITSTQFTVNFPVSSTTTFNWEARYSP